MSNVAEVSIPVEEFALRETLERVPDAEFEIERVDVHGTDRVLPSVWATGEDLDAIEAAIEAGSSVERAELLIEQDEARLFRTEWVAHTRILMYVLTEGTASILNLSGFDDQWAFACSFPTGTRSRRRMNSVAIAISPSTYGRSTNSRTPPSGATSGSPTSNTTPWSPD
jgi:hypothetical protein